MTTKVTKKEEIKSNISKNLKESYEEIDKKKPKM